MSRSPRTKDERFLMELFKMVSEFGDLEGSVDRYLIGRLIGQNDKGVDTIVRHLCQANFIKKGEGSSVFFTPHGLTLVQDLFLFE